MSPDATVRFLNDLFGALEPAIHDHGGFVDSYIGDAIMALFDGPPSNAIDAALAMLAALERHNETRRAVGQVPVAFGIGIHTGPVRLGTIGGPKRLKCSVFGDSVNLAARVEQLTRRYATPLLVSGQTLELVGEGHITGLASSTAFRSSDARAARRSSRSTTRTRSRAAPTNSASIRTIARASPRSTTGALPRPCWPSSAASSPTTTRCSAPISNAPGHSTNPSPTISGPVSRSSTRSDLPER